MQLADEVIALAKVQARTKARAVRITSTLQVWIDPHAAIIAPIKMAGEESIWAVAHGFRDEGPEVAWAIDPRNRDDEAENTLAPLARFVDRVFNEAAAREIAPQVWVASGGAVRLLDAIADRRRSPDPAVALLARHCWFLVDRFQHAGQQVLISAVEMLERHFATGQSPLEDQHLGAVLAWIDPPDGADPVEIATIEEERPAGVLTDVESVDMQIDQLLEDLGRRRREGETVDRNTREASKIKTPLCDTALRVYTLIDHAISVLERQGLPEMNGLHELHEVDRSEFSFYTGMNFVPTRWSDKQAAMQLVGRESAVDRFEAKAVRGDRLHQDLGVLDGEIVEAAITHCEVGPKGNFVHFATMRTSQVVSKLRVGDVVAVDAPENISVQLIETHVLPGGSDRELRFQVKLGKKSIGRYEGHPVRLLPAAGGFDGMARQRLRDAHDSHPWVLSREADIPSDVRQTFEGDPLALLEDLR